MFINKLGKTCLVLPWTACSTMLRFRRAQTAAASGCRRCRTRRRTAINEDSTRAASSSAWAAIGLRRGNRQRWFASTRTRSKTIHRARYAGYTCRSSVQVRRARSAKPHARNERCVGLRFSREGEGEWGLASLAAAIYDKKNSQTVYYLGWSGFNLHTILCQPSWGCAVSAARSPPLLAGSGEED